MICKFCWKDLISVDLGYQFRLIGIALTHQCYLNAEFWKQIPPSEPYRVILGDVRDKLYNTRERARQLLANGISDIPEDSTFTNVEQVSY